MEFNRIATVIKDLHNIIKEYVKKYKAKVISLFQAK